VARELTVEGDAVRFMVDGDLLPPARLLRLSTGPAVQLLAPPARPPRRV